MEPVRALYRAFIFVTLTVGYVAFILLRTLVAGEDLEWSMRMRRSWARLCSRLIGVRIEMEGVEHIQYPAIFISNHRSYFDPVAQLTEALAMPVAKAEVSAWPLVGFAARSTGTLYVKRESKSSRQRTLEAMREALEKKLSILIYPEGTTHIEPHTIEFRPGAFRLAAQMGVPVVPIAIDYRLQEDAWVGDDTFLRHFFESFGRKHIHLKVRFGAPVRSDDYRQLIRETQSWIDQHLGEMGEAYGRGLDPQAGMLAGAE